MYAIGGSAAPTINSKGNRYTAPANPFAKDVSFRLWSEHLIMDLFVLFFMEAQVVHMNCSLKGLLKHSKTWKEVGFPKKLKGNFSKEI